MFVAARVTARLPALDGTFGLDDWFIVAAWVLMMGFTIILSMLSYSGLGKDVWMLPFDNITETLKLFTVLEKVYTPTTWFTKISILFLYLRLFPDHVLRRMIKIGLGLCAASLVCLELACIFKCWPIGYSWTFWDGEHHGKCTSMSGQGWANASVNMFADIAVLILPLPTIWRLKLPTEKKLGITAMFSVGLFVTVVSMVRLKTMKYFNFSANATCGFSHPCYVASTNEYNRGLRRIVLMVSHRDLCRHHLCLHARHAGFLYQDLPWQKVGEDWCQSRIPCREKYTSEER